MSMEFVGIFITIVGYVVGLGAVTVIDLHGFLGRRSTYWTEATIRTHKITKPLIWLGISLVFIGGIILYLTTPLDWLLQIQFFIWSVLTLNGLFLSYKISPELLSREKEGKSKVVLPNKMQEKIFVSFIISFLGWWSSVILFTWFITLI